MTDSGRTVDPPAVTHGAPAAARRGTAALLVLLPTGLALAGLGVSLRTLPLVQVVEGHLFGGVAMAAACGGVAALLLTRLPRHPVGRSFAAVAFSYALSNLAVPHGSGQTAVAVLTACAWVPGVAIPLSVLPVVFPDGPRTRLERTLLRADLGLVVLLTLAAATVPRLHLDATRTLANPFAVPVGGAVLVPLGLAGVVLSLLSIGVLLTRLVRSAPDGRRQIAPFVVSGTVAALVVFGPGRFGAGGAVAQDVALLLVPLSALVCVLRYRLYDLEVVVRRVVVWTVLSAGIVGGYVLLVQAADAFLRVHGRPASVLATGVVALAFGPVRTGVSTWVARWLFGDRDDPYAALTRTTSLLAGGADPRGALQQAADDLASGLRCPGVRVMRGNVRLAGPAGGEPALVVPLRAAGVEVGRLEVLRRSSADAFSLAERRLLTDLAAPLASAVEAVGLAEDLRRSRDDIVRAREEERRRIRSELHDDIGPALAALLVQAQLAKRRLARADTGGGESALDLVQATALRAVADLRRVVDDLRPEALDEVGLAEAVRNLAAGLSGDDLRVACIVADLPVLPAAVEVAAIRIVGEGLHNVRKHARAGSVSVCVDLDGDALVVGIDDDGVGPGAASRPGGKGLPAMRARVEELAGSLVVGSGAAGGGTRLVARLPLVPRAVSA